MEKYYRTASLALVLTILIGLPCMGHAGAIDKDEGRYYEPVEVPGEMLTPLLGQNLDRISVYAYQNGSPHPILFQIDEMTPQGMFILTRGPEANLDQANHVLDKQDLLVFMARDAGQKAPAADNSVEVVIIDTQSDQRLYVYVTQAEDPVTPNTFEPLTRVIDTPGVFNLRFTTYGYDALVNEREDKSMPTIFINKLWVEKQAGGNEQNILDRQKIRGYISFLGGLIKVPINEKIVSGGIVAYKPGPVRILTHSVMYPLFPLGIKGPKFNIDTILADTLTLTVTTVDVPFDPGSLITEMALSFGTDLTPAAKGMRYHNSTNLQGFTVDGKMSGSEKKFNEQKDQWRLVTGPQGTQIQFTKFDKKFMQDGQAFSTYSDDESEEHPPENNPGDICYAADKVVVRSLPTGTYKIETFGCVPYDFYDPSGLNIKFLDQILDIQRAPLTIEVQGNKIENRGAEMRAINNQRSR